MSFSRLVRDEKGLVLSEYLGMLGGIVAVAVASVLVLSGALGSVAGKTLGDEEDGSGGYLAQSGGPLLTPLPPVPVEGSGGSTPPSSGGGPNSGNDGNPPPPSEEPPPPPEEPPPPPPEEPPPPPPEEPPPPPEEPPPPPPEEPPPPPPPVTVATLDPASIKTTGRTVRAEYTYVDSRGRTQRINFDCGSNASGCPPTIPVP